MPHDLAYVMVLVGAVLMVAAIISYALVGFWLPIVLLVAGGTVLLAGIAVLIHQPPA